MLYRLEVGEIESITSLVPDLLAGRESAIDQVVNAALRRLIVAAMRYGASREDAEEIALEAIFKTSRRLKEISFTRAGGKDPLFNYMVKAVRNATIERHRAKVRERGVLEDLGANLVTDRARAAARFQSVDSDDDAGALDPDEPQTPSLYSSGEAASPEVVAMREFLQTLSEQDRLILQLQAEGVMTSKEIGEQVGLNDAAVRQRVKRLHDHFRKERQNV